MSGEKDVEMVDPVPSDDPKSRAQEEKESALKDPETQMSDEAGRTSSNADGPKKPKSKLKLGRAMSTKQKKELAKQLREKKRKEKEAEDAKRKAKREKQLAEIAEAKRKRQEYEDLAPLRAVITQAACTYDNGQFEKSVKAIGDNEKVKNFKTSLGFNALHVCVARNGPNVLRMVKFLVEEVGFDVNEASEHESVEKTPLELADETENEELVQYLKDQGAE